MMIKNALDKYNRTRPFDTEVLTITGLVIKVLEKTGKDVKNSSIVSLKQTFRRIDTGQQETIPLPILVALSEIFAIDYNTLISYWI